MSDNSETLARIEGYSVTDIAKYLEAVCGHHDHGEGWIYSRKAARKIKHIRFEGDLKKHFKREVPWHLKSIFGKRPKWSRELLDERKSSVKDRILSWLGMASYHFKAIFVMDDNLPDGATGTVRNGHHGMDAITFWEEDGEIIEAMGPTVGLALAKFLQTHPTHSHAEMIAEEIRRILLLSVRSQNDTKEN